MSIATLAAREADRDESGSGYYLIVTMHSGRIYRGALCLPRPADGMHAVGTIILELPAASPPPAVTRRLYINEAQVESIEIEW